MRKINTAIVGCGVISDVYLSSLQEKFSVIQVTACSDLDEERMRKTAEKYGLEARSYSDILKDEKIELIINLTSPAAHYPLTKQALEHGKHVYSEKTMATEYDKGKELCLLADQNHVRLGAAPDTFLGGGIQTAKYMVEKGAIGKVLSGVLSLSRDYGVFGENLPHLFRKGGSVLYDMGCYYLTAVCSILGPVKKVAAFGKKSEDIHRVKRVTSPLFGQDLSVEDYNVVTAILEFEDQALVTLHLNAASSYNETFHLELYGETGILYLGDPNTFGGEVFLQKPGNDALKVPFTHGFLKESRGIGAAEMAWAILHNRPHRAKKEMALHVLEIIHGIEKSQETGSPYKMESSFEIPQGLPEGFIGEGFWQPEEESALV